MQQEGAHCGGSDMIPPQDLVNDIRQLSGSVSDDRHAIHLDWPGECEPEFFGVSAVGMQRGIYDFESAGLRCDEAGSGAIAEEDCHVLIEGYARSRSGHLLGCDHQDRAVERRQLGREGYSEERSGAGDRQVDRWNAGEAQSVRDFSRRTWEPAFGRARRYDDQTGRGSVLKAVLRGPDREVDDGFIRSGYSAFLDTARLENPFQVAAEGAG